MVATADALPRLSTEIEADVTTYHHHLNHNYCDETNDVAREIHVVHIVWCKTISTIPLWLGV